MAPVIKKEESNDDNETVVYLGDDKPVTIQQNYATGGRSRGPSESKHRTKSITEGKKLFLFYLFVYGFIDLLYKVIKM